MRTHNVLHKQRALFKHKPPKISTHAVRYETPRLRNILKKCPGYDFLETKMEAQKQCFYSAELKEEFASVQTTRRSMDSGRKETKVCRIFFLLFKHVASCGLRIETIFAQIAGDVSISVTNYLTDGTSVFSSHTEGP